MATTATNEHAAGLEAREEREKMQRALDLAEAGALLTGGVVAAMANCHPTTLWRERQRGRLRAVRVGRSVRYRLEDVREWLGLTT